MRPILRTALLLLLLAGAAVPTYGQWTALGDMPRPSQQGNALRFENAQAVAVVTALSPEVIRVRVMPGREIRDHSYAVINRDFGDPGATFSIASARGALETPAFSRPAYRPPHQARAAGLLKSGNAHAHHVRLAGSGAVVVWRRARVAQPPRH